MQEVTLVLRFTRHCLGGTQLDLVRTRGLFSFPRDSANRVVFPPSWWRSVARFGAQVLNVPTELIERVEWSPFVDGTVNRWRRILPQRQSGNARQRYAVHEAFLSGDTVCVHCVVPTGLDLAVFQTVMNLAGEYKGVSPFKPGDYGKFEVTAVTLRQRHLA
jgi:hypothetical protein